MAGNGCVKSLEELTSLDEGVHWFCPRTSEDDNGVYYDDDINGTTLTEQQEAARSSKLKEAKQRQELAFSAMTIIAFDGSDAVPYQNALRQALKKQLGRCDICIREFHRSRLWYRSSLESEFDTDEVQAFMQRYDALNNERIKAGLDSATESLLDLPPHERSIMSAGEEGMYAMLEALQCKPFLNNEDLLVQAFDKPFKLAQTNKKFTLPGLSPGNVAFLYSANQERCSWALRNFKKLKRHILPTEFEYSIKPFMEPAATRIAVVNLDMQFLPVFWRATRMLLEKMDTNLIRNHLRAMAFNIYTLSLDHFQINADHFPDLIASYEILLDRAPRDFWDAMGSISPSTVLDTIFRAPRLDDLLTSRQEHQHDPQTYIEQQMTWIDAFIRSVKASNLVPPLRTILGLCLKEYQGDQYSHFASTVMWEKGLTCLLEAIKILKRDLDGGPAYTHLIEAVSKEHMRRILQQLDGIEKKEEPQISKVMYLSLDIIENILALDVKSLSRDRQMIESQKELDHELGISSLNVWKLSIKHMKPGHPTLAMHILSGITGLLPLDKLPSKIVRAAPKSAQSWNHALDRVLGYIEVDLLNELDRFSSDHIVDLFIQPIGAKGVIALLFSGNAKIHGGALSLLKTLSGEDTRRESVHHVVQAFTGTALSAFANSLKLLTDAKVFGPCSTMLKLMRDVFSCLCDDQDGVLRTKTLSSQGDISALRTIWIRSWYALDMVFSEMEAWSALGYEKAEMQDFCRDAMDTAEYMFDQYAIFASTMEGGSIQVSSKIGKQLLGTSNKAFHGIMKWLRLRDEYLIGRAVTLTCKMLNRFQEVGIKINEDSSQWLEDAVVDSGMSKNAKVKTKLTMNHKAELQQALEGNLGESLSTPDHSDMEGPVPKKQGSIAKWAQRDVGTRPPGPSVPATVRTPRGVIDIDNWASAAERQKHEDKKPVQRVSTLAAQKAAAKKQEESNNFLLKRKQAMQEQERKKQEAIAKAKLGAGSGVAGIGNLGADHGTDGQTMMVNDEDLDSDEDEEEDVDDDLFGTGDKPKKQQRPELRTVGLKPEVKSRPTRIQKTARSLKDMRARIKPPLGPIHQTMLSWEYFHNGDFPPQSNAHEFRAVENSFRDPSAYQLTFEPLLMLEAWQGIVRAKEENSSKPYELKVMNRSNVDQFIEFSSIIGHPENREVDLRESDIVLLSTAQKPMDDSTAAHCLARVYKTKRQKAHIEVVYQVMPTTSLAPKLTIQALVYGLKLQSIVPLERQYGALKALQYYDLCNQIVRAKPSPRIKFSAKQISGMQDVYNLNPAQSEAVNAALENEGFSLIQGPPGSGKTKTITAIVGGLLTQSLNNATRGAQRINVPQNGRMDNGDAPSKKLLVCAPSNAAVDELCVRLMAGIKTKDGAARDINVVRIGRSDNISTQVQAVTMDNLVEKRMNNGEQDTKQRGQNQVLFNEHKEISANLREMYQKRDDDDDGSKKLEPQERKKLEDDINSVRRRKAQLGAEIDKHKDQERNAGREQELNKKRAQQAVLDEAHVICATLSGSGHDMFQSMSIEFETVIIDEAAQCIEMESLIPLKYGCIKCIMVGDPNQLPPTVFSKEAKKFMYEQSLFVRMQNNFPKEVHLLDTQYRMHPDISFFPSETFYDSKLMDGPNMGKLRQQPWHASTVLAPYRFFDVSGQQQSAPKGHSLINLAEIDIAMMLYNRLRADYKDIDFHNKIGIITPYKSQLKELKRRFNNQYGEGVEDFIEFNTTDAFQGRECEIIIFSCVRASSAGGIGFLQDIRRMNVGLTRAKSSLWVLGHGDSLSRGAYWKKLVDNAVARDCYTTGDLKAMLKQPSSNFPARKSEAPTRSMLDVNNHQSQMESKITEDAPSTAPPSDGHGQKRPHSDDDSGLGAKKSRTSTPATADADKMQGVTIKYEDRIAGMKQEQQRSRSSSAQPIVKNEDVDMEDADALGGDYDFNSAMQAAAEDTPDPRDKSERRSVTPANSVAGQNGAANSIEMRSAVNPEDVKNGLNGKARNTTPGSHPGPGPLPPLKKVVKKAPQASPFLPKKKPGGR